jgi:hypothetical protein
MKAQTRKSEKSRSQKTQKKLKKAALGVFGEKRPDAAVVEEIAEKTDLGKDTHLTDATGFILGGFSFAMIGMTSDEIDTTIEPLRRVFVRSLSTFLGR